MNNDQYKEIKQLYPDKMLLFRVGDLYEARHDDALEASRVLGLLTKQEEGMYICAFPSYALNSYLPRLIREGNSVAICDDISKPVKEKQPKPTATQLSLFDPHPTTDLLRYRDEVAKEMLLHNFKNGVLSEDAAGYANRLVKRLYGVDLGNNTLEE